jgi:serine/threonine-protein kinase
LYGLFGGCRFGYEQALHRSPELLSARSGLVAATVAMVDYELAEHDPKAARALVAGLPDPPAALVARVAEAERIHAAEEEKRRRLEQLGEQHDTNLGARTRLFIATIIATIWTVQPLYAYVFGGWATNHRRLLIVSSCLVVAAIAVGIWARESLTRTAFNRSILVMLVVTPVFQLLLYLGCMWLGIDYVTTDVWHLFLWSVLSAGLAGAADRRFMWPALAFAAGWLIASRHPDWRKLLMAGGNLALLLSVVVMWYPEVRRQGLFRRNSRARAQSSNWKA